MTKAEIIEIVDNFDLTLFLQRDTSDWPKHLECVAIRSIETSAIDEGVSWVCGKCGRANPSDVYSCQGCNAPRIHGRHKGRVSLESWLPHAAVFYGIDAGFSLYVTLPGCGRRDKFDSKGIVYHLANCKIKKMGMADVLNDMREEGECPDPVTMLCEIECDVVFVGAPWDVDQTKGEK